MSEHEFWPPSIDPLQELYNQGELIKSHNQSLAAISQAVNNGAAAIEALQRHNQHLLKEIHALRSQIANLESKQ